MLLRLNHENLIKVYSCKHLKDGSIIFDLEYCEFSSLAEIIDIRNIDMGYVNNLISGVLKGLSYLHGRGFVHGDIKPSNILIARYKDSLVFKLRDLDTIKPNCS